MRKLIRPAYGSQCGGRRLRVQIGAAFELRFAIHPRFRWAFQSVPEGNAFGATGSILGPTGMHAENGQVTYFSWNESFLLWNQRGTLQTYLVGLLPLC